MTYGDPFQSFLGREYSEVVYHSLLGASLDHEAYSWPHRLALLPGGTVGIELPISGSAAIHATYKEQYFPTSKKPTHSYQPTP